MKGVYFDWDGTLVDSLPLLFASHNHVRVTMGLHPWTREEYMQAMVQSTRALYPTIYGERAQEAQDMLYGYISDIIYVGDTESDLSCATEAGCPVVFIRGHAPKADELIAKYKPAYVVHNLAELQESLKEFLGFGREKKAC